LKYISKLFESTQQPKMENIFAAWQSSAPMMSYLTPFEISKLSFANKRILSFSQQHFKRVKKDNTSTITFCFAEEMKPPYVLTSESPNPINLRQLRGKMMKIHKSSEDRCRYIGQISKDYTATTTAIIQIAKIIIKGGAFVVYGWILSGKNIMHMTIDNEKKFRPYPFWGIINSGNSENYTLIHHTYQKIEPSF
tara:strand:- start:1107 stop:1688 length:582 start_codon:yes stop_codon:yes gene_type:complete